MAIGACSREEPHPKFFPATMKSPGRTPAAYSLSMSSMQCFASSAGSEVLRYRAGMITSVSTSSPYFQAFPFSSILVAPLSCGPGRGPRLTDLVGAADAAEDRGGRRHRGVCEVHLALGMPH